MLLSPVPKLAFLGNNGRPLVGGQLFTYEAGTSTKVATYSDEGGTPNTNPIELDFRGEANVWIDPQLTYKFVLAPRGDTDPPTNPIWSVDDISALGGTQTVGQVLYPRTDEEIAAGITPVAYQWPPRTLTRYSGIVADGSTDCTSAMLTVCNAMGGQFTVPYNVLYDRLTLLETLDADVILFDLSQINDLTSPGETTKNIGIVASDVVNNDSAWFVQSGHHPGVILNNFGTSGTQSGDRRLASLLWADGMLQNLGLAKRGSRGSAAFQFLKDPAGDWWINKLTSYAPWPSIEGYYEEWQAGEVIPGAGVYRRASGAQYVSASSGTTADPAPSNFSGTAPDGGGVQWTFLDSADRTVYQVDEYGRWLIGSDAINYTFEHLTIAEDPGGGSYSMALGPFDGAVSKTSQLQLFCTDSNGDRVFPTFLRAVPTGVGTGRLELVRGNGGTTFGYFDDVVGFVLASATLAQAPSASSPAITNNGTIDTTNVGLAKVTPAGAVTGIILEAGIVDGQEVTVANQSGSTVTFAAYATSNVASGTSCVIAGATAKRFVWESVAAAWYECT